MAVHKASSVTLFKNGPLPAEAPRTVITFGVTRGGTSMIAGAVRGFGFHYGDNLPVNNEDPDFTYKSMAHMKATIKSRDEKFPFWGFKFPMAANYLDELLPLTRNPMLIVVARDFAATASALNRWHGRDISFALSEALLQTQKNFTLALRWRLPTLFVSYERAVSDSPEFLGELAEFLDMKLVVAQDDLLAFMKGGSYKSFDEIVHKPAA